MNHSYWERNVYFKNIDVAIIGGGIVGLSAAIECKQLHPNKKIVVFEKGYLPSGASTKNAGFACFGSPSELLADIQKLGATAAFELVEKRWRGLQQLRQLVGDDNMDFQQHGGYELFAAKDVDLKKECIAQLELFNNALLEITHQENVFEVASNVFGFAGIDDLIANKLEAQIHPGKMMQQLYKLAIEKEVKIVNGFEVSHIENTTHCVHILDQQKNKIEAQQVIIANNGFAKRFLNQKDVRPARNQVLVTSKIDDLKLKGTFHYDEGYIYFRNIDNRVLIGGARNMAMEQESTNQFGLTENIKSALIEFLKTTILPNQSFEIEYEWSGIMGVGATKQPIIEKLNERVVAAVRLGGMGIAIGNEVGRQAVSMLF